MISWKRGKNAPKYQLESALRYVDIRIDEDTFDTDVEQKRLNLVVKLLQHKVDDNCWVNNEYVDLAYEVVKGLLEKPKGIDILKNCKYFDMVMPMEFGFSTTTIFRLSKIF